VALDAIAAVVIGGTVPTADKGQVAVRGDIKESRRPMDSFITACRIAGQLRRTSAIAALALLALSQPLPVLAQRGPAPAPAAPATPQNSPAQDDVQKLREMREEIRRVSEYDRLRSDAMAAKKKARDELQQKDQATLAQSRQLLDRLLQLPDTLKLSAEGRALAEATLQPHRERVAAAWPALQDQAISRASDSSGKRKVDFEQAALDLSARAVNEAALWFADAEPHASDAVWIEALRRDGLCQGLAGDEPAARMAALIDALPAEQRASAWAGEAARLARWGQATRTVLPPPERALEDGLVPALAPPARAKTLATLPEALRMAVQAPGWTLAAQTPAQRCELLRWWSQEQVRVKRMSPRQAMLAWRTALAVRSADFLLAGVPRDGAEAIDKGGYPIVARRLGLSGRVVVEQDVDAAGKPLQRFVQRRELRAAGLGELPPVGLERELDAATLARVASAPATPPAASTLQGGVATQRMGIEWAME
jgi:hypothetical protein